ncbi:hypothetical protein [Pseudoclavibacter endophyticus]|nr:hypothetical protein [Pseudoclavibacter endophyticus]
MTMYAADDIRSKLAPPAQSNPADPSLPVKPAQYLEFLELEPNEVTERGSRTWHVRSTNAVLSFTEAKAGDVFRRADQPDEYTVLSYSESAPMRIVAKGDEHVVAEPAFAVVPPGASTVEVLEDGVLVRLFSANADDLRTAALNADAYADPDLRVAPLRPGPDPQGGFRLRVYPLADAPISPDRFGRIFRTTNLMVNFVPEETGPRDATKLSPHFHDDFEQLSFGVKGRFTHHVRYPWGPDSTLWRDDEHRDVGTPSVCIIPPPTVHTSQGSGTHQQLLDIFAPPREDFAEAGWVLNADDYPAE